ncbi:MAG: ABC transporter substrate-binding protein [Desulfuromonadales bacterium]|nr:ABC transporter substrate-binding protein [Desulfuromonadales bacterium]
MLTLGTAEAAPHKVLVVMSYHESMPWEKEIREGIEAKLAQNATIKYVYMNTKNNFAGGAAKAREALEVYYEFKPDGIIAADDDAVSLFVVPYIKDRVKTPVMFCGVNAEPEVYGFPASNVSGILERAHFRESIAFLHQLKPSVRRIAFLTNDNPTGKAYQEQIRHEAGTYPSTIAAVKLVKTLEEALVVTRELKKRSDALFVIAMEGLLDASGKPLSEKDAFRTLSQSYGKPVIGINEFNIKSGLLCAVAKSGQEQGATAAKMLLQAMQGTPVSQIPISRNKHGKRLLNITVMKALGIVPRPVFLVGTQLVDTESE